MRVDFIMQKIIVKNVIEDSFSPIGGHKLGNALKRELEGNSVSLDFDGISPFTSLFFNAMFADLKELGDLEELNKRIIVTGLESDDLETYERCKNNAINKQ